MGLEFYIKEKVVQLEEDELSFIIHKVNKGEKIKLGESNVSDLFGDKKPIKEDFYIELKDGNYIISAELCVKKQIKDGDVISAKDIALLIKDELRKKGINFYDNHIINAGNGEVSTDHACMIYLGHERYMTILSDSVNPTNIQIIYSTNTYSEMNQDILAFEMPTAMHAWSKALKVLNDVMKSEHSDIKSKIANLYFKTQQFEDEAHPYKEAVDPDASKKRFYDHVRLAINRQTLNMMSVNSRKRA